MDVANETIDMHEKEIRELSVVMGNETKKRDEKEARI